MAIQWEEQQFLDTYSALDGDPDSPTHGQVFTYGKRYMEVIQDIYTPHRTEGIRRARRIVQEMDDENSLDILPNARILIIGTGFGDLIRSIRRPNTIPGDAELIQRDNVWGMDHSTFIQDGIAAQGAGPANTRTIFADFMDYATQAVQDALTAMTGGTAFRLVITDDVVSSFTPAELPSFLDICESAITGSNFAHCIHFVKTTFPGQTDPDENATMQALRWLRFNQWVNQRDTHSWLGPRGRFELGV